MSSENILEKVDFEKCGGLVPVIVQDVDTREVLMLAYANREALLKTLETGLAHFWSRSRKRLWLKGESSGNYMRVLEVRVDCDGDALVYLVRASGPACHTGSRSCFYRVLARLDSKLSSLSHTSL